MRASNRGRLWLGEANVAGAEGRIAEEGADFAIALMHHPFDDLHEIERWMVERRCERVFDVVLRGHLHQERTRSPIAVKVALEADTLPGGGSRYMYWLKVLESALNSR